MSTAIALPRTQTHSHPRTHYTWLGTTKLWCIQTNCDGRHHFYCSCGR
jgi:hypothetical protein